MDYFVIQGIEPELNKVNVLLIVENEKLQHYFETEDFSKENVIALAQFQLDLYSKQVAARPKPEQVPTDVKSIFQVDSFEYVPEGEIGGPPKDTKVEVK